jgi:hypothetical protein
VAAELDEVRADVVVGVPEVGVDPDRRAAFADGRLVVPWKLYVQPRKVCASAVGTQAIDFR